MAQGNRSLLVELDERQRATATARTPSAKKPKSKKARNEAAANEARSKGAKTRTEKALESRLEQERILRDKQGQLMKVQNQKRGLDIMMDKIGGMPPDQIFSEQGYQAAKQAVPSLDRDVYFNRIAPRSVQRKRLVSQLNSMPMGTQLSKQALKQLKASGIDNPNQYMRLSAIEAPNTMLGAVQRTALGAARGGDVKSPLFAYGQGLAAVEAASQKAAEDYSKSIDSKDEKMMELKVKAAAEKAKSDKPLSLKNKTDISRGLNKDLFSMSKKTDRLHEYWKNINDFSNPEKAMETFRLQSGDSIEKGVTFISDKKGFQNIRDIALIYSYIKMIDPESTVREGEVKLADKSLGALAAMGINVTRVFDGETLNDRQRNGILSASNDAFYNGTKTFRDRVATYDSLIEDAGLNRESIVGGNIKSLVDDVNRVHEARQKLEERRTQGDVGATPQVSGQFNVGNVKVEILPD